MFQCCVQKYWHKKINSEDNITVNAKHLNLSEHTCTTEVHFLKLTEIHLLPYVSDIYIFRNLLDCDCNKCKNRAELNRSTAQKLIILGAAYLYQRIHQSLSISQSLVCADCVVISHFVIYKWHEDDWSRVLHSATAGKILAELPFTSQAAPAPFLFPRRTLHSVAEAPGRLSPRALWCITVFCLYTKLQLHDLEANEEKKKLTQKLKVGKSK